MDSNSTSLSTPKNRAKNRIIPKGFDFEHRKTPSFSSFSSSSSPNFADESSSASSPPIPSGPPKLSGIPFSWEIVPGIPKKQSSSCSSKKTSPSTKTFLPPPPPSYAATPRKQSKPSMEQSQWDPFVAALFQCSKDQDSGQRYHDHREGRNEGLWTVSKVSRSISDRFEFIGLYRSCKLSCSISESILYLPAGAGRRGSYDLVNKRHQR